MGTLEEDRKSQVIVKRLMGSSKIVFSEEWGKCNSLSPAYQRELLPLSLKDKSKEL